MNATREFENGRAPGTKRDVAGSPKRRIRLLDVGSCYDPFRRFEDLEVTAFDLCPAPTAAAPTVFKGDMLTMSITPSDSSAIPTTPGAADETLKSLPQGSFDVVTLCLVLSYIPDPWDRTRAVWNARRLLRKSTSNLPLLSEPVAAQSNPVIDSLGLS